MALVWEIWILAALLLLGILFRRWRLFLFLTFATGYFLVTDTAYLDALTGKHRAIYDCSHPQVTPDPQLLAANGQVFHDGMICTRDLQNCWSCSDSNVRR